MFDPLSLIDFPEIASKEEEDDDDDDDYSYFSVKSKDLPPKEAIALEIEAKIK
jgi:hypothetical protein